MSSNVVQPQASGSSLGLILGLIFMFVVMPAIAYFVYKKYRVPYNCNSQDADTTLNIASWLWVPDPDSFMGLSGNCTANTCATNFGTDAKGKPANASDGGDTATCPSFNDDGKFLVLTGAETSNCGGNFKTVTASMKRSGCESQCDPKAATPCTGYDWKSTDGTCDIVTGTLSIGTVKDGGFTCYQAPAPASK